MRLNFVSLATATTLLVSIHGSAQIILTDVALFHSDSGGTYQGDEGWDTSVGGAFKVWLLEGGIGGSTFLNGPTGSEPHPSFVLAPGTHTIGILVEPGGIVGNHGLNVYFDGASVPGISVMAPDRAALSDPTEFYVNGSASTLGVGQPGVPATASLTYTSGGLRVTLTEFYLGTPGLYTLDQVGGFNTNPSGTLDRGGLMTLEVTAVPEPRAVALMAGLALLALAGFRRLRPA